MASDELRRWIRAFFEGTWLVPGWNARIESLLSGRPPHERDALRERLQRLGDRIAPEWARENRVRRIDSGDLERWGGSLSAAASATGQQLEAAVAAIESEVDERLA
jgi:hypothetical protein